MKGFTMSNKTHVLQDGADFYDSHGNLLFRYCVRITDYDTRRAGDARKEFLFFSGMQKADVSFEWPVS